MKINLKTISVVAAACALPIAESHAWPVMTPEQLKTALETIRLESTSRSDCPFKIEEVNYTNDGVPTSIKGIDVTPEQLDDALLVRIKPFSLSIHNEQDLGKAGERLQELSETLSAEILEKRGIGVAKLRELGIKEVREITFNSTLNSHFFTDEQRKKAKVWFENKEELEEAIEDYADNYPYDLFFYKCEFHNRTITNDKQQIVTSTEQTENRHVWGTYFVPRTEGLIYKTGEELREKIKNALKNMLLYKNGKEKVILLLLLDEATPKKDRLKWGHDDDDFSGSFHRTTASPVISSARNGTFCRTKSVIICKCTSGWFKHSKTIKRNLQSSCCC